MCSITLGIHSSIDRLLLLGGHFHGLQLLQVHPLLGTILICTKSLLKVLKISILVDAGVDWTVYALALHPTQPLLPDLHIYIRLYVAEFFCVQR